MIFSVINKFQIMMSNNSNTKIIVAIDGPSASGKGTVAKKIADHFNIAYLNTGALYRAVALQMQEKQIAVEDLDKFLPEIALKLQYKDLENPKLFLENCGQLASKIAQNPRVRNDLLVYQKNFVKQNSLGCVLDGRDTTTVICPEANFKFFITANVEIRAKRRYLQLKDSSPLIEYSQILQQLKDRDANDLNREFAPLKIADDAIFIDNGDLTIAQTFDLILKHINLKISK